MKTFRLTLNTIVASLFLLLTSSCVKELPLGSIQGLVSDASTNEPIQGVNVSLSPTGLSSVTGSDGRYEFTNLSAGSYTVQAMSQGYESNTKNISVVAGNVSSGDMLLTPDIPCFKLNVEYLDFGTNFSQLNFKIINASISMPVDWSITESMGWLTATPSSGHLEAGQQVLVSVTIDRDQIEQSTTANLTVSGEDQTVVLPVNVSVSGTVGPQLQLSETSLDFGTSANSLAFYVMNTGPAGTSLNWTCSNVNEDWLMVSPTSGYTDGGSSTAVMVTIDRTKIQGNVSTSVTVSGAGSTSTVTISASSEGGGAAILQLSEGSLDFGETEVSKTFLVKNVGSVGTVLDWMIINSASDWLTFAPMTGSVNAGASTTVTAVVDRNKFNGVVSTTVTVNGSNNNASLSVTAANVQAEMEVSTNSVDFGNIATTKTITISNVGDAGSSLHWSFATPSVSWLTVNPMSGTTYANQSSTVTLTVDRNAFVGNVTTDVRLTGANTISTISISVDNSVIVTDGLIAYFTFDSDEIVDWSGNYTGLNYGALLTNDSPSGEGHSMQFDGETSYIYLSDNIIQGGVPYSVNLWFKTGRNSQVLFGTNAMYYNTPIYYMRINESSCVHINAGRGCDWTSTNPITAYVNNQWHMLTFTYNGNTGVYYIDGVLLETVSANNLFWETNINAFYFGKHYNTGVYYGKLDNFRSYNRALTQAEVRAIFNAKQ